MSRGRYSRVMPLVAIVGLVLFAVPAFAEEGVKEELRSLTYVDKPIEEVVQELSDWSGVNIVASSGVTGNLKIKLKDVTWRWALELIVEANNLCMIEDEEKNVIKIMTQQEALAQSLTTRVYNLVYLQAADYKAVVGKDEKGKPIEKDMVGAGTMLEPLLDKEKKETIKADPVGNKLIVTAMPKTHYAVKSAIARLDTMLQQVEIEVRFVETSLEAAKNLGIKWDFLKGYGVGLSNLTREWSQGTEEAKKSVTGWSDTSTAAATDSLVTTAVTGSPTEALRVLTKDFGRESLGMTSWEGARNDVEATVKTATLAASNISLVLSALFEDKDTKMVSHPNVKTLDHKLALIKVVRQYPIPKWAFNSETGTFEVQGVEFKDIGVTLKVTPHVNENSLITLDVDPELSAQIDEAVFSGGGGASAKIPIVDTRNATSSVRVKSGETLVIGGLVTTQEVANIGGVPLLKEIPVLGYLFKHSSKSKVSRELLVFITPTIVEGPGLVE